MSEEGLESNPGQNVTEDIVTESLDYEEVPEKRKNRARYVSVIIFAITAILVLIFCFVKRTVDVYRPDATQKNTTNKCYFKEEKLAFSSLFATALGLFGVVLGTLVDRLSLINEERHHLHQRYRGSWTKMVKACFSGISRGPVIILLALTGTIVAILIFATEKQFELGYLTYSFSGIGVGPLVMHLLNLNTQSEVHLSTIREQKQLDIANGLAYSYYFNYLKEALPTFKEITSKCFPAPHKDVRLTSNKLLLLMPHDCYMKDDLKDIDNKITKAFDTGNDHDPLRFRVYCLEVREREYKYFAIQYVKEPLITLREMSKLGEITLEDEIKLLCRELSRILNDPPDPVFKETCTIVSTLAKNPTSLKDGGLVGCIMDIVQPSYGTQVDGPPRFVKPKESKKLFVDVTNPSKSNKATTKSTQTDNNPEDITAIQKEQQSRGKQKQIDVDTKNKHDDESIHRKKSANTLKRKYGEKKSDATELQVMIPKSNETQNDSGASTSGNYSSEIERIRQSDQQDEHSLNNNQDRTETEV